MNCWVLCSNFCFLHALSGMDVCEIDFSSDVKRNYLQNVVRTFNTSVCLFKASFCFFYNTCSSNSITMFVIVLVLILLILTFTSSNTVQKATFLAWLYKIVLYIVQLMLTTIGLKSQWFKEPLCRICCAICCSSSPCKIWQG